MVVEATKEDLYDVMPLLKAFFRESGYDWMKFDNEFVAETFLRHVDHPDAGVFLHKEENGEITGMLAGVIMGQAFSTNLAAYELTWYVAKDSRGTKASIRLIDHFEEWAKEKGAQFVSMSSLESLEPEKVEKFYHRKGYKTKEHTYIKELA